MRDSALCNGPEPTEDEAAIGLSYYPGWERHHWETKPWWRPASRLPADCDHVLWDYPNDYHGSSHCAECGVGLAQVRSMGFFPDGYH